MKKCALVLVVVAAAVVLAGARLLRRRGPLILSPSEQRTMRDAPNDEDLNGPLPQGLDTRSLRQSAGAGALAVRPTPQDALPDALQVGDGDDVYSTSFYRTVEGYNIWSNNCHTAADMFVNKADYLGIPAGIVVCRGDPQVSQAYHTFDWIVLADGRTCLVNWGHMCCWNAAQIPPSIGSGDGQQCVRKACGRQYSAEETRVLPVGKTVEWPTTTLCAITAAGGPRDLPPGLQTDLLINGRIDGTRAAVPPTPQMPKGGELDFNPDRLPLCLSCCDGRAAFWKPRALKAIYPEAWGQAKQTEFQRQCADACLGSFHH